MKSLMSTPSAWVPLMMSLAAFALVIGYVAVYGIAEEPPVDEGPAARLFQMLLVGQLPIIAFFAIRWLPEMSRKALQILALQIAAALSAFALVLLLEQ